MKWAKWNQHDFLNQNQDNAKKYIFRNQIDDELERLDGLVKTMEKLNKMNDLLNKTLQVIKQEQPEPNEEQPVEVKLTCLNNSIQIQCNQNVNITTLIGWLDRVKFSLHQKSITSIQQNDSVHTMFRGAD